MKYHIVPTGPGGKRETKVRCPGLGCPECDRLADGGDRSWPKQPGQPRNQHPVVIREEIG